MCVCDSLRTRHFQIWFLISDLQRILRFSGKKSDLGKFSVGYKARHPTTKFDCLTTVVWVLAVGHVSFCVSDCLVGCFRSFQIVSDCFRLFQIIFIWNFRFLTKFQIFDQISEFRPNFRISTKFQNFDQISEFQPNLRILTNFRVSTKFQNFFY